MTPTASKECGRTDQTKVPVSGPLLPDVESQQMAMAGVPSSVHPPHQPSFLPPRPSVARYSPKLSPFPPLEPALHMRGLPVEQRTWSGRLEDGQGAMGDPRLSLPVQAVKAVSEYQSPRRETVTHRPEDPEKGCLEESARTARQYNHHATPQLPAVKIKYIYSDVSEEDSDAEEHTVWILVSSAHLKLPTFTTNTLPAIDLPHPLLTSSQPPHLPVYPPYHYHNLPPLTPLPLLQIPYPACNPIPPLPFPAVELPTRSHLLTDR